jgi:hypothetical protein
MLAIIVVASMVASSNVRSTDPVIGAALTEGVLGSDVIRRLVEVIDASDVIVYLARGDCPRPAVACLMMGGSGSGVRYVRINFQLPIGLGKKGGWHRDELSVMIAHELQHAAEVAQWPDVVDNATLEAAYARRGLEHGWFRLETDAARQAGDDRRAELLRQRRR